ncbi:MAG TPA: AMP-binding protein, partial [Rhodocyclaceae bacterium]
GTPSALAFSHADLIEQTESLPAAHPGYPQAGDLFWSPAAWSARAGLLEGLLPAWRQGQPVVAYDGDVSAEAAFALIDKYDVRNARLTPQELEAMMSAMPRPNESLDCRLRTLSTGGMAAAPALAEWLQAQLGVAATA